MKLSLGTVQFGLDYGISNHSGQTSLEGVKEILDYASDKNIDLLDTAHSYGDSESILGASGRTKDFKIVTKTVIFKEKRITAKMVQEVKELFLLSLEKLKVKKIYGLMVHNAEDLIKPGCEGLFELLDLFKKNGLVEKIGVSAYKKAEVNEIIKHFPIDLVQVPVSIFDQRLIQSETLQDLHHMGVEVHVRSAFLQGLIFMEPEKLSAHFNTVKPLLRKFQETLKKEGYSAVEAALGFLNQFKEIDRIVCGVNNVNQLQQIYEAVGRPYNQVFDHFSIEEENILNPSSWK